MSEYIVQVNQDNSIDIPPAVRDRLVLEPGDKIVMRFDNAAEHVVMGKLPMEAVEKARELEGRQGKTIKISP